MNVLQRAWTSLKAAGRTMAMATTMRFGRGSRWSFAMIGGSRFDYGRAAGDGRSNAAVMACMRWAQRALPEAPLQVMLRNRAGDFVPGPEHDLQVRLESPNPNYDGMQLMGAVIADLMLTGNAYIRKIRGGGGGRGRVIELWWMPSWMVEPRWPENDPGVYIGWYDYIVDGWADQVAPEDVIHIRQGFDPHNLRKGLSDIMALVREIATDNEAANWTASVVRNGAPPSVVVSPEGDSDATPEELEDVKDKWIERFGGDNRGAPLVMKGPTKVTVLSFSPEQMNLRALRQIPEERITAVLGIPAAVVGLGAGLDVTKVGATMREMREQAYESALIPLQRLISSALQLQLVPDYGDPAKIHVQFDLSQVRVLQDDQNALHTRARADLLSGGIDLNDFLQMIGKEPLPGKAGNVRFIPNAVTVVLSDDLLPKPLPQPAPASADQQPASATGDGASDPAAEDAAPADEGKEATLDVLMEIRRGVLAAGYARNGSSHGHADGANGKTATLADLGPALQLSDADLDRLSHVEPDDLDESERYWRRAVEGTGLEDLIDADTDTSE